jgi:hypothetical protein
LKRLALAVVLHQVLLDGFLVAAVTVTCKVQQKRSAKHVRKLSTLPSFMVLALAQSALRVFAAIRFAVHCKHVPNCLALASATPAIIIQQLNAVQRAKLSNSNPSLAQIIYLQSWVKDACKEKLTC